MMRIFSTENISKVWVLWDIQLMSTAYSTLWSNSACQHLRKRSRHVPPPKEKQSRNNAQKMKFLIMDFFSKCEQFPSFLRTWSHLLKKSLVENFIFYELKFEKPLLSPRILDLRRY